MLAALTLALALALTLSTSACSAPHVEQTARPGFEPARYARLAVLGSAPGGSTQALVDEFLRLLLARGVDVVDAGALAPGTPDERAALARRLDVPGLLVVSHATDGSLVLVDVRLFDAQGGDLVWMGQGDAKVRAGLIGVAGAAVGVATGHRLGGVGGAIAGGVLAGRGAAELAPKQLEVAQEIVAAIVDALPRG